MTRARLTVLSAYRPSARVSGINQNTNNELPMTVSVFKLLNRYALKIVLVLSSVAFLVFFPKSYATIDEHDYLGNAQNIVSGTLRQHCTDSVSQFRVGEYCIYKYNIGTSFFYIPYLLMGMGSPFLSTFLAFLGMIWIFSKILRHFKLHQVWTIFFAFYPPFVYYSRTLLSEQYSALLILTGLFLLLKNSRDATVLRSMSIGIVWGFAVLVRYSNVLVVGILLTYFVVQSSIGHNVYFWLKRWIWVVVGVFPLAIFFFSNNDYMYGHFLRSGYYYSGEEGKFLLSNMPLMAGKYLLALVILYPGMIVLPFWTKNNYKWPLIAVFVVLLLFYASFSGNNGVFEGRILDLILGVRFLIPVIPLVLLLYFQYLDRLLVHKNGMLACSIISIILMINMFLMSAVHQDFLNRNLAFFFESYF